MPKNTKTNIKNTNKYHQILWAIVQAIGMITALSKKTRQPAWPSMNHWPWQSQPMPGLVLGQPEKSSNPLPTRAHWTWLAIEMLLPNAHQPFAAQAWQRFRPLLGLKTIGSKSDGLGALWALWWRRTPSHVRVCECGVGRGGGEGVCDAALRKTHIMRTAASKLV